MSISPFTGARLKIIRAYGHLKALLDEIDAALEGQPNAVLAQIEPETGDKVYRAHMPWQPPREWGLILGDVVHNLRSSLDHMVWDLVLLNGCIPDGSVEFPIYWDRSKYDLKNEAARKLRGVHADAAQLIEEAQPYHGMNPKRHPLWLLRELDVIDKHRSILLTSSVATLRSYGYFGDLPETPVASGPGLNDQDEIFRIPARTHAEQQIHPSFICDIALDVVGPSPGLPVRQATRLLYGVVSRQLHYMEYRLLGVSPAATANYPHLADPATLSPTPPKCRVLEPPHG